MVTAEYEPQDDWSEFCSLDFNCEVPGVWCYNEVEHESDCRSVCTELGNECKGYEIIKTLCLLYSYPPTSGTDTSAMCHEGRITYSKQHSQFTQILNWNEACARGGDACESDGMGCCDVETEDQCREYCIQTESCASWSFVDEICTTTTYLPEVVNSHKDDCHDGAIWYSKIDFKNPDDTYLVVESTDAFCEIGYNCKAEGVLCIEDVSSIYYCRAIAAEMNAGGYQIGQSDCGDVCVIFDKNPSEDSIECEHGVTYVKRPKFDEEFEKIENWSEFCSRGNPCDNGASCSKQSHIEECHIQCLNDNNCQAWEYISDSTLCVVYYYVPISILPEDECHQGSTVFVQRDASYADDTFIHTPQFSAFCLFHYDCEESGITCNEVQSIYDCRTLASNHNSQGYEVVDGICIQFNSRPRLDPETTPSVCTTPEQETYINYRPTNPPAIPEPTTAPCDCKIIETCMFVNSNERNLAAKKAKLVSALDRASDIHKQCCVSFKLHTGRVHELNYSTIPVGKNGKTLGDILLPDGTVPSKKVGTETILVDPAGNQIGDLEFSDILYAVQTMGKQLCPDVTTPRDKACKRLRVFAFEEFAGTSKLGLGLRPGRTIIIELNQHTLGTTLAHEAGHNLGLKHTEDDPGSDENADPNNIMHEESITSGNPTRLSTYEGRATLSERQCEAERAKIDDLDLCHTTLLRQQCPNTTWDAIREEIRRVDEQHQRNLTAINNTISELKRQLNKNITNGNKRLKEVNKALKRVGAPSHKQYNMTKEAIKEINDKLEAHEKKIRGIVNDFAEEYKRTGKYRKVPKHLRQALHYLYPCIRDEILKKLRKAKTPPYGKKFRFPFKPASPEHDDIINKCIKKFAGKKSHNVPVNKASPEKKLTAGYRKYLEQLKKQQAKINKYDKIMAGPVGDKYRRATEKVRKAKEDKSNIDDTKDTMVGEQDARHREALDRLIKDFGKRTAGVNSEQSELLSSLLESQ